MNVKGGCVSQQGAMKHFLCAFALLLACVHGTTHSSHTSHDHGSESHEGEHFEAAAVYDVEAGTNSFIVVPSEGGAEGDPVVFMVVPATSADLLGLEGAEMDAEPAWDAYLSGAEEPTILASGELLVPTAVEVFQVSLADPLVVVQADVSEAGAYAVFTEHGADTYTTSVVSPSGAVLVAAAEEGAEEGEEEEDEHDHDEEEEEEEEDELGSVTAGKWGNAVIATLLISCCSFTGMIFLVHKKVASSIDLSYVFMLASGALLAAPLLHIIPEAMEGLEPEYDSLHDLGLYSGLAVLGGISFGALVHAVMGSDQAHQHGPTITNGASVAGTAGAEEGKTEVPGEVSKTAAGEQQAKTLQTLIVENSWRSLLDLKGLQPVCWNVVTGDLVHNFADGVTIGAAFLSCSTGKGWIVTASTLLCEVPHELADFMALLHGGMSVKQAFAFNFLSALSAVLGAIVIMALGDSLTNAQVSIILLVGAGSFIFISLAELVPEALTVSGAVRKRGGNAVLCSQLLKLASYVLGALLIGIPLIFDEHCSAGHEGHDH